MARPADGDDDRMTPAAPDASGQWRWWSVLLLLGALVAVSFGVAALGAAQAARGERVLRCLDPTVAFVQAAGWQGTLWILAHSGALGAVIAATVTVIALLGLVTGGSRALPIVLLAATVSLAAWGQLLILADQPRPGALLYGLAVVGAIALGAWCPLTAFDRVPWFPRELSQAPVASAAELDWRWEGVLVVLLSTIGLGARLYALTELPQAFELEMVESILKSRTTWGLSAYIRDDFMSNSIGILHLLPGPLVSRLFGTSAYSVRLTSVLLGVLALPLAYVLVRRLVGVGGAVVAIVLMSVAPEQLYWSRLKNANFAPIAILALVSANLGLWMVQRFSVSALLCTALWIPISRFAYAPAYVLVGLPILLYSHALMFVRRAWRAAWYTVPLLIVGLLMWIFSLSFVLSYVRGTPWQFIHPAFIFGAPLWRRYGEGPFRDAGLLDLIRLQAVAMSDKLGEVVAGLWQHDPLMFSQWYLRICPNERHLIVLNAAVAALFAVGLGYLLGQIYLRRAFLLLCWVAIGLLPAILSDEPTTRRLSLLLPAVHVIVAVWLAAAVGIVRSRASPWLVRLTGALVGVAVAAIAGASLASHLRIPMGPMGLAPAIGFGGELLRNSDMVLYSLNPAQAKGILLGNFDTMLSSPRCYQTVGDREWLPAILRLPCDFNSFAFKMTVPPERYEAVRQTYQPHRISFLLEETPYNKPTLELLQHLFPAIEMRRQPYMQGVQMLASMTVDIEEVQALRSPSLMLARNGVDIRVSDILQGVPLIPSNAPAEPGLARAEAIVRGGLFLERDGWYDFKVGSPCSAATLTVDEETRLAQSPQPMLGGVHPFELSVPSLVECQLPLQILGQAAGSPALTAVPPAAFVSPRVASATQAVAPPVTPYSGYGSATTFASIRGGAIDFAVGAQGNVTVLSMQEGAWHVHRFDGRGHEQTHWQPQVPPGRWVFGMVVDSDDTVILSAETWVLLYDPVGKQIGAWEAPWAAQTTDIALSSDGHILLAIPTRESLAVFTRDGTLLGEVTHLANGPKLSRPASVTVGPGGRMLVIQSDGHALLLRMTRDPLVPMFEREFTVQFTTLPITARGSAFDGPDRLLIPDPLSLMPLTYSTNGVRMMAAQPARDLTTKELGQIVQFQSTPERLYALEGPRVWSIER